MPKAPRSDETAFTSEEFAAETEAIAKGEVVPTGGTFKPVTRDDYVPVDFQDAFKHLSQEGDIEEFEGSPFHVVDKNALVGRRFIILDSRIEDRPDHMRYGTPWVTLIAVTETPVLNANGKLVDKVVINDGSTGIASQVYAWHRDHPGRNMRRQLVDGGLRVSEYDYTDDKGITKPASTFYLS